MDEIGSLPGRDVDADVPGAGGDAAGIVEQDLGGTHLDQERRETGQVGEERADPR